MKADQERRKMEEEIKRKAKIAEEKEKVALRYDAEEKRCLQEQETVKMKIAEEDKKRAQEMN